jgi:hypothetical protein
MYDGEWRPPQPQTGLSGGRSRTGLWIGLTVLVIVLLLAALLNNLRTQHNTGRSAGLPTGAPFSGPTTPSPNPDASGGGGTSGGGSGGAAGGTVPAVACPVIRDEESHLAYNCVDNYLVQDGSDSYLGLRIALNHEVEPGWVISEGSGNPKSLAAPPSNTTVLWRGTSAALPVAAPSAQGVIDEVRRRTDRALQAGYGDNPTARTLNEHARTFSGVVGYESLVEITINPAFRASHSLKVKTERLWVVGLPTPAGISIFMLTIPDERADLWPKAEATVGTVHII